MKISSETSFEKLIDANQSYKIGISLAHRYQPDRQYYRNILNRILLVAPNAKKNIAAIVATMALVARIVSRAPVLPTLNSTTFRRPPMHPLSAKNYATKVNSRVSSYAGRELRCFIRWPIFVHLRCFLFAFIQKALFLVDIPLWSSPFVTVIAYSLSTSFYVIRDVWMTISLHILLWLSETWMKTYIFRGHFILHFFSGASTMGGAFIHSKFLLVPIGVFYLIINYVLCIWEI